MNYRISSDKNINIIGKLNKGTGSDKFIIGYRCPWFVISWFIVSYLYYFIIVG